MNRKNNISNGQQFEDEVDIEDEVVWYE